MQLSKVPIGCLQTNGDIESYVSANEHRKTAGFEVSIRAKKQKRMQLSKVPIGCLQTYGDIESYVSANELAHSCEKIHDITNPANLGGNEDI